MVSEKKVSEALYARLTHKKFSLYIHARISPIIHAQKFPTIFTILLYLQLYHYLNNLFCLFAYVLMCQCSYVITSYVPMSQRNSRATCFLCLVKLHLSLLLILQGFSFILSPFALFISLFTSQPVSVRHVLIQRDCFTLQYLFSSII